MKEQSLSNGATGKQTMSDKQTPQPSVELDEETRRLTTALHDELRDVYINPDYVGREQVADAIQLLTLSHGAEDDTNTELVLHPYSGSVSMIADHEWMPAKVEWAARVYVDGLNEPLWASYTPDYGIDISTEKLYWLRDCYQEHETTNHNG